VRGDELYVWQGRQAEGWHTIAAGVADAGEVLVVRALVTRSRSIAETEFRPLAEAHAKTHGVAVRLGRFKLANILEVHKPTTTNGKGGMT
jgi:hypothetical protein